MIHQNFSDQLWDDIQGLFSQIIEHPFVLQLSNGSLAKSCFAHYLIQDMLYIEEDAKALKFLSDRSEKKEDQVFFLAMSEDCVAMEQVLQNDYLHFYQLQKTDQKSEAIHKYTEFLLEHSKNSEYAVAAAALLPCFWVYHRVGKEIIKSSYPNNPYQKWIMTYEGKEFEEYVQFYIDLVNSLAKEADDFTLSKMRKVFFEATSCELNFFQEAFQMNKPNSF